MSTLYTDNLFIHDDLTQVPVLELTHRVLKQYRLTYTSGQWNPDTNYNWVPGMNASFAPVQSNSRIRVTCHIPYAALNAAHAITHWIFYANGVEQGRHSISGNHLEDNSVYIWDLASWGTGTATIGYQMRSYANDNNELRIYTTRYWNGGGSNQNAYGQFLIEEYLPGYY